MADSSPVSGEREASAAPLVAPSCDWNQLQVPTDCGRVSVSTWLAEVMTPCFVVSLGASVHASPEFSARHPQVTI